MNTTSRNDRETVANLWGEWAGLMKKKEMVEVRS